MIIGLWGFVLGLGAAELEKEFLSPPDSARPWVYFMVMDGNLTREGITADFEAMKRAGIGGVIFIEVNVGIPRGPVDFMSPPWQDLFAHAVTEADRLGLEFALATGPGWCGTGGPWVKPELSMQHLVASETNASGPARFEGMLPRPQPRTPYFGQATLTPALEKEWREFYRDEYVIAFPTPKGTTRLADIGEKALYYRDPYSSKAGVKAFLPAPANHAALPENECIASERVVDLTGKLKADGRLVWDVPAGEWTVMRFGRTITGQTSRPAPEPGLGLESDKFSSTAIKAHFERFLAPLLNRVKPHIHPNRGLTTLHFDSWEMSAQNWSTGFQRDFQQRRGYSLLPWLPVLTGRVVGTPEASERFLWDLRQTAQELVVQNHLGRLKQLGRKYGLKLSVEPYDLNPCADLELGVPADVPQCEFWSQGHGFSTEFSAFEAVSLSHTLGRPLTAAEAFTALPGEDWRLFPAAMKNQGDWAFCCGINRFIFHRYQHQPWLDRWPGMTFASYGVHWDRTQTWWDMAPAYHLYLSRCQAMLRRGQPVADILYLTPEGAPMVFRPPSSAVTDGLPDRRGYNFDGCAPSVLLREASVKDGCIAFPGGMSYRLLVLPEFETMTPGLLATIKKLVEAGATVVGAPPAQSPSLEGYPRCDTQVKQLAAELWGDGQQLPERNCGKGHVILDTAAATQRSAAGKLTNQTRSNGIYPDYSFTAEVLARRGVPPDFATDGNVRYIHRTEPGADIYFVASRTNAPQSARCSFRVAGRQPELWNPVTGERRDLPNFAEEDGVTTIPLAFAANESYFLVFRQAARMPAREVASKGNFPGVKSSLSLAGPWEVSFDPKWGGPEKITFTRLEDWSRRPEPGIKYYSGKAVYRTQFDSDRSGSGNERCFLSLGEINGLASVTLNGESLGVVWCPPWRVEVPPALLKAAGNLVEITVANLWPNRLIGDLNLPPDQRLTWTTRNPFKKESPLLPSGLLGPVTLAVPTTSGLQPSPEKLKAPPLRFQTVVINNVEPRRDQSGAILDAHDGCLQVFGGRYYLYGTAYGKSAGFSINNRFRVYSSPDLAQWTFEGELLQGAPDGVYYRPYVVFNPRTRKYVLFYNWYPKLWEGRLGVATSDTPVGPFTIANPDLQVSQAQSQPGDGSPFVDEDGTGYFIYTVIGQDHAIRVEQLTPDYLGSTGKTSPILARGSEAPAMFRRGDHYYALFDRCCCFCTAGSGARVFTSNSPLGPFAEHGNLNLQAGKGAPLIPAQQTWVAQIPTAEGLAYIWMGDRWGSRPDGIKGHDFQFWSAPLKFAPDGSIQPLENVPAWQAVIPTGGTLPPHPTYLWPKQRDPNPRKVDACSGKPLTPDEFDGMWQTNQ